MSDNPTSNKNYQEKTFLDETTGLITIKRTVAENGHPILSPELVIKYARARLNAAKALNKENKDKNDTQKAKDAWGLNELEKNLGSYLNGPEDKVAEQAFQEAKEKLILAKDEAKVLLDYAQGLQQLNGASPEKILAHEKEAKLVVQLAEKEFNAAFDEYYEYNLDKLKKVNRLLAHYVDPDVKNPEKVIKKINTKAHHLRAKEVRPVQENHYKAIGLNITSSHIPEGELTSSQKTLYQEIYNESAPTDRLYTNPSTIRDKFQVGQANALRTEIKVGDKVVFKGHRHGSPCVLKIENKAERQYRTMQNLRQTMAIAAKEKIEELKKEKAGLELKGGANLLPWEVSRLEELNAILVSKTKPLPLDMATMCLLSPVADDNPLITKKIDDPMKQYRQVNDSRLAYWSLQGREIALDIPGQQSVQVKLNSTFMSVGVNSVRGVGTLEAQALVQRVNNRGLNNLVDGFLTSLKTRPSMDPTNKVTQMIRDVESDKHIQKHLQKIEKYDNKKLQRSYARLEEANIALHQLNVDLQQAKLQSKNPEHKIPQARAKAQIKTLSYEIKKQKLERNKAMKVINKEEKKLDVYYRNLAAARKKAYIKALPVLQTELTNVENNPLSAQLNKGKTVTEFQKARLFVDTLDTFYNQPQPGIKRLIKQKNASKEKGKLLKKLDKETDPDKKIALSDKVKEIQEKIDNLNSGNYQFQARFALLAQNMNNFIEWFCKSGEDRTGLLNEHIEAYCIFIEKNGYPPRWGNAEDDKKFHEIMPLVHNGAPNRETNGANDDAPALKVSDEDFKVTSVSYYTDKRLANMAPLSSKIKEVKPVAEIIAEIKKTAVIKLESQPVITPTFQQQQKDNKAARRHTIRGESGHTPTPQDQGKKPKRHSGSV